MPDRPEREQEKRTIEFLREYAAPTGTMDNLPGTAYMEGRDLVSELDAMKVENERLRGALEYAERLAANGAENLNVLRAALKREVLSDGS